MFDFVNPFSSLVKFMTQEWTNKETITWSPTKASSMDPHYDCSIIDHFWGVDIQEQTVLGHV